MIVQPKERGSTPGNFLVTRSGEVTYLGLDRADADWQKLENAVAAAVAEGPGKATPIQPRDLVPAPAFSLPDLQGKAVRLSDFKGKPLVANFFTAQSCRSRFGTKYPLLRGDQATQLAWIGERSGWATFFVSADGKILKAIKDSIDDGMEGTVFPKYADQLVSRR
ncbi:MAG: redoxin domain-containing protein [Chloroflexi bacterium]|nr:MAG: redoxin domain-containing protein [Chloroflexota bacterium]